GQCTSDCNLLHFDFSVVGHLKNDEIVGNLGNATNHTTGSDNLVTLVQARHQVFVLLGTLGLRTPDQEIESQEEAGKQDNPAPDAHSLTARRSPFSHGNCTHQRQHASAEQFHRFHSGSPLICRVVI